MPPPLRRRGSRTWPAKPGASGSREPQEAGAETGSAPPQTALQADPRSASNNTRDVTEQAAKTAYGRHRGEGSGPSGNTNATANGQAKNAGHSEETSAAQEPPGSDPGCAYSATHTYGEAASTAASDRAPRTRIQPIRLRGCRATISAPRDGRSRHRRKEEGVQPKRARPGNMLFSSYPIEHQPPDDHGHSREPQAPGDQTRRSPHALILVEQCELGHSADTELPVLREARIRARRRQRR